mgnify:CR=1 FL=1
MYETMIEALLDKNAEAVYCDFHGKKRWDANSLF